MHINDLLKMASSGRLPTSPQGGSHPVLRINGELSRCGDKRLMQEDTIAMAFSIMSNRQKQRSSRTTWRSTSPTPCPPGRFRCNVFQQRARRLSCA